MKLICCTCPFSPLPVRPAGDGITNTTICEQLPNCELYDVDPYKTTCYTRGDPDCYVFGANETLCGQYSTCAWMVDNCIEDNNYLPPHNCSSSSNLTSCENYGCYWNLDQSVCEANCQLIYGEDRCELYSSSNCFFSNDTQKCEYNQYEIPCKLHFAIFLLLYTVSWY